MKMRKLATVSALVIGLGLSGPAFANDQNQNNDANGNGGGIGSLTNVVNDFMDYYYQDNAADTATYTADYNSEQNGNTSIVATQTLKAENINHHLDEVVDLDGTDDSPSNVGYNSGDNYVRGNAFAAYAGILNQAWNSGINANTQAATNIAAQGTVNFGVNSGSDSGSGSGDD